MVVHDDFRQWLGENARTRERELVKDTSECVRVHLSWSLQILIFPPYENKKERKLKKDKKTRRYMLKDYSAVD